MKLDMAFILALAAVSVGTGNTGVVVGVVTEAATGSPIPQANVVIVGSELGSATDESGRYLIRGVAAGRHVVAASAVGYETLTRTATVPAFGRAELNFRLAVKPVEMAPVEVRPPERVLADGPVPTEVVTQTAIVEKCAANVQEALRWQPGVSVKTNCPCSNAGEVQIQGMAGKYTQVLVDGAPTITDAGSCYGLTNLPAENVERLEVVKGPGGLRLSSDAIAGAVNIVTKSADRTGGSVGVTAGSYGTLNLGATMSLKTDSTGVTATLSKSRTDPVDVDRDGNSDYVKSDRTALALKALRRLGAGLTLVAAANVGVEERHGGALERIAGRSNDGLYQNPNILQWGPTATLEWQPAAATSFTLRGAYSDYRQRVFAAEQWFTAFEDVVLVEAAGRQRLGAGQELQATLAHRYERLVENMRVGVRRVRVFGATVQDDIRFGGFTITPHVRVEHHSDYGPFLTPGIAGQYRPAAPVTLRGSFGLGSRTPPTFSKLTHFCPGQGMYDFIQNPELRPERSTGGNLGVEYHPGDFVVAASLFRTNLRDMIEERLVEYDTLSRLRKYQHLNVGAIANQGFELNCGLRPIGGFSFRGGYAFTDARNRESGEALAYRSRHSANWQVAFENAPAALKVSLTGELVGSMPTQRREDEQLVPGPMSPTYTLWNVRAAKEFGSVLMLSAGIDNVFGYVQSGWLVEDVPLWGPSRGRAVNFGARFTF